MRGIASVFAVNVVRVSGRPWYVLMTSAFILAAIAAAVFVANHVDGRPTIAYVAQDNDYVTPDEANAVSDVARDATAETASTPWPDGLATFARIETLSQPPPLSALMRGRYDAVIVDGGDSNWNVLTVRGPDFEERLHEILSDRITEEMFDGASVDVHNPAARERGANQGRDVSTSRGVGATIVGFLTMFVLISGATYMNFFTDDKTGGTFRRIVASPVGVTAYLAGQLVFNATMLFVPMMGMLVAMGELLRLDIGFSYGQYAILCGLLTVLATAFGFFVAALVENVDDGMAIASGAIIVTSLLGGTFFVFEHDDALVEWLTRALPQKHVMNIAVNFEAGLATLHLLPSGLYVLGVATAFFVAGGLVCVKRLRQGAYL